MLKKSLIESLHSAQEKDRRNFLSPAALKKTARENGEPLSKVYGTATFYTMFSLKPRGRHIIKVCGSLACHMDKASPLAEAIKKQIGVKACGETSRDGLFTLEESSCLGLCDRSPAMMIDDTAYGNLTPEKAKKIISAIAKGKEPPAEKQAAGDFKGQTRVVLANVGVINPESLKDYAAAGGYKALEKALAMKPAEVVAEIKASELRGRGGAGFPTGLKWASAALEKSRVKYIVCNADEGEPGTFKDRQIMEGDPHKLVEGMIIAGCAVGASKGYIYVRGEYALSIARLKKAIADAQKAGFLGENIKGSGFGFSIEIARGAGAYVCGEESALLESLEGRRGEPRKKPPYPAQSGFLGHPTVVNNVETLAAIPAIISNGAKWFKSTGTPGSAGTKIFCLMGDVQRKGAVELPFGVPLSKIIKEFGGGVTKGRKIKAVILGGVSGSLLTPKELDTPVDFNSLAKIGAGPGSGAIIVLDDRRSLACALLNAAKFFVHESCGRCTPCRQGTRQLAAIIERAAKKASPRDCAGIETLGKTMALTSFCALGQTAPSLVIQAIKKFGEKWADRGN